ncbi:MAG: ABC transporter ATP-binding protein [Myxococcota bacterium]
MSEARDASAETSPAVEEKDGEPPKPSESFDSAEDVVLRAKQLKKTFFIGFFRKRVEAVRDVSFEVQRGEIFGLLGPNGAGKTTTIKMILRLIFPTKGSISIFGVDNSRGEAMRKVGYMPENPYVYQYLKPLEFLDLCGRLNNIPGRERRRRAEAMVDTVGLRHAVDRPIGKFSKGMMQRVGLAQALLHDPELLILDEPMSGLDPIGRKEVRDILLAQRARGKTLIFTSHILSDVELLCDRVVILQKGIVRARGTLDTLLEDREHRTEIALQGVDSDLEEKLRTFDPDLTNEQGTVTLVLPKEQTTSVIAEASNDGAEITAVNPVRQTLEDLFLESESKTSTKSAPSR